MSNDESAFAQDDSRRQTIRTSDIRHSFDIRHSSFDIYDLRQAFRLTLRCHIRRPAKNSLPVRRIANPSLLRLDGLAMSLLQLDGLAIRPTFPLA